MVLVHKTLSRSGHRAVDAAAAEMEKALGKSHRRQATGLYVSLTVLNGRN